MPISPKALEPPKRRRTPGAISFNRAATAMLGVALALIHRPHRTVSTAGRGSGRLAPAARKHDDKVLVGAGR